MPWDYTVAKTNDALKLLRKHRWPAAKRSPAPAPPAVEEPEVRFGPISEPRPADGSWRHRSLPRVTILLVEDDYSVSSALSGILQAYDCVVLVCTSAAVGFATAKANLPHLIVTDFNLPDRNGYELIRQLRQHEAFTVTPIVMLSGSPRAETLGEALEYEVVTFLRKPARREEVLETFQRALGGMLRPRIAAQTPAPVSIADPEPPPPPPVLPPVLPSIAAVAHEPPPQVRLPAFEPPAEQAPVELKLELNERPLAHRAHDKSIQSLMDKSSEAIRGGSRGQSAPADQGAVVSPNDPPIIKFVNAIVSMAVEKKASDIHIEPQQGNIKVRFRIDGTLVPQMDIPANMGSSIAARIKVMSQLNITEKRVPQDGRFRITLEKGTRVEFRVSSVPSKYGEKIVMRVLGQANVKPDLSTLRLPDRDRLAIDAALANSNGLILVTGPTGSGKTTTLYTMIGMLNTPGRNIMTIEDPIEYELPGITQVAVNNTVGLTFEKALRAFLRQDPDVMLVGEIRDAETAAIAVKAAITGHLVLSTLHTNDAATSISRLGNMGVPNYMLAAALRMVVAQRLIRLLCLNCKMASEPTSEERAFLTKDELLSLQKVFRPAGCPDCNATGFKGRAPILEVLPIRSASMRELITSGAPPDSIQKLGETQGLKTLRAGAFRLVENGETSLCEAFKLFASD